MALRRMNPTARPTITIQTSIVTARWNVPVAELGNEPVVAACDILPLPRRKFRLSRKNQHMMLAPFRLRRTENISSDRATFGHFVESSCLLRGCASRSRHFFPRYFEAEG